MQMLASTAQIQTGDTAAWMLAVNNHRKHILAGNNSCAQRDVQSLALCAGCKAAREVAALRQFFFAAARFAVALIARFVQSAMRLLRLPAISLTHGLVRGATKTTQIVHTRATQMPVVNALR